MRAELEETFRPEKYKMGVSAILYAIGGVIPNPVFSTEEFFSHGIPFPIYRLTGVAESMPPQPFYEFWIPAIIVNMIVWYVIGSSLVEIYRTEQKVISNGRENEYC